MSLFKFAWIHLIQTKIFHGWWGVGGETQIIITNKLRTRLWRISEVFKMFDKLTKLRWYRHIFQSFWSSLGIFSGGRLLQIALPPLQKQTAFGSPFDHLLTSPRYISVHEKLHIAQKKSSNGHVIFLHISTERNTDKTFYQIMILRQALKQ